ncbi:MAG: xanthine dehydrogenase family protein molybdopterin-binding subunit [Sphingobacteriales bacterium]|nr:MAG: xanthine dehydrogenase family protein molybdopterin-binding subunit [Sphingobacteriales bacterium]
MGNYFFDTDNEPGIDRVDGRAKVTGTAKYAAEHKLPNLSYAVLVGSNVSKGTIAAIDTKTAERSPGVLTVITHLNAPKLPGYTPGTNPAKPAAVQGLKIFNDNVIHFNGQPIAVVVADSFERATHAASLIKAQYNKEAHETSLEDAINNSKPLAGARYKENVRGDAAAWKSAAVTVEETYEMPLQVHNPMELHATTAMWEGEKLTVWEKTQGVKSAQQAIMQAFGLQEKNVQVNAPYVGGGFGAALRTWPHTIAAIMAAQKLQRPVRLVLTRPQMFLLVGYRPVAVQHFAVGADASGKLVGMRHEASAVTSNYETFNEGLVTMTRVLYNCPNLVTKYNVYPVELSTPTWMRGPGEATGSFPLECGLDELAYKLNIDPIELRIRNHADIDPENGKPYSSKFLKEAYQLGAEKFGWGQRSPKPASMKEGEWQVGYGMSTGLFTASRGEAKLAAKLSANCKLLLQSAVSDSGPGTATAMVAIATEAMGMKVEDVTFELGDSSFPTGPTQGGSTTTSTLGAAVSGACVSLKKKLAEAAQKSTTFGAAVTADDFNFSDAQMILKSDSSKRMSYSDVLKNAGMQHIEILETSGRNPAMQKYSAYSYSVHFVKVLVHPLTGVVKISKVVTAGDAGKIVSYKTAESQMIGGVVGGIGGALMEEGVVDDRYGRWVNNNFADYHVPVHADVPAIEAYFVNKPDPVLNPVGSKGMGEIALIGFAAAVANAVFHATGKRIRKLPITPDKLL